MYLILFLVTTLCQMEFMYLNWLYPARCNTLTASMRPIGFIYVLNSFVQFDAMPQVASLCPIWLYVLDLSLISNELDITLQVASVVPLIFRLTSFIHSNTHSVLSVFTQHFIVLCDWCLPLYVLIAFIKLVITLLIAGLCLVGFMWVIWL